MRFFNSLKTPVLFYNEYKVRHKLVLHAYIQLYPALFTSLTGATFVLLGIFSNKSVRTPLIIWYLMYLFLTFIRIILVKIYFFQKCPQRRIKLWKYLFVLSALLGGLSWGLSGFLLFPLMNGTIQQTLLILTLAGVTAGSIATLSAVPMASFLFLILSANSIYY